MYAFIEFERHPEAQLAMVAMNKRDLLGREMKVNWATSPGQGKVDISKHFHIFVGDLSPDIEAHQLREAFAPFGPISNCTITRDPNTHQSKGFGFICFFRREDAEMAIAGMNGQWLGGRAIRTNWATGKSNANSGRTDAVPRTQTLSYDDVYAQTDEANTTVYCGGIQSELTEELMRENFDEFGEIQEIKAFRDKGYAFIRFDTKDTATRAIVGMNGKMMNGYTVKCSWGKTSFTTPTPSSSSSSSSSKSQQQQRQSSNPQPSAQQYSQQQQYGQGYPGSYYNPQAYWASYMAAQQQGAYPQQQGGGYPGYNMPQNYGYGQQYGNQQYPTNGSNSLGPSWPQS
jgi:nucleolysin TIA-1/TIAR